MIVKFQDIISGVVVVESVGEVKHDGMSLQMEGSVSLQLSAKNAGLFEFSNSVKVTFSSSY